MLNCASLPAPWPMLLATAVAIAAIGAAHFAARPHRATWKLALVEVGVLATVIGCCLQLAASWSDVAAALVFVAALGFLAAFDARRLAVPVLPIVLVTAAGLGDAALTGVSVLFERGAASLAGWAALFFINRSYLALRGREGLGAGDALVVALIGAWLSFEGLAWSVALGAAALLAWSLFVGARRGAALPLVPGLGIGAACVLLGRPLIGALT